VPAMITCAAGSQNDDRAIGDQSFEKRLLGSIATFRQPADSCAVRWVSPCRIRALVSTEHICVQHDNALMLITIL